MSTFLHSLLDRRFTLNPAFCLLIILLAGCGSGGGGNQILYFQSFKLYWSVVGADLNGDGKTDIVATYTFYETENTQEGFVAVFLQNPSQPGNFLSPTTYPVGQAPLALAVADLNGDGKPDLVVANNQLVQADSASNHASVLLQDPANPGHYLAAVDFPTGLMPTAVAIADFNGDGKPDLILSDFTGISILVQNPAVPGTFLPYSEVTSTGFVDSVAVADLNRDGKPDLVATDGASVQVLLQTQSSPLTFAAPVKYSAGLTPVWIVTRDLDGDGNIDLVVDNRGASSGGGGSVSVLLQDASAPGTFLAAQTYSTGRSASFVAVADLNADNAPDLCVANAEGSISILFQRPDQLGTFLLPVNYPAQMNLSTIATGDFNSDGRADLVISDSSGLVIRLQDPAGPGTFQSPVVVAAP